jgi:hypothetical protein
MSWRVGAIVCFWHHGSLAEALEQSIASTPLGVGFEQEKLFESICFEDWALVLVERLREIDCAVAMPAR